MAHERFEFGEFVAKVRSQAEDVIVPNMTVEQSDAALRDLAISLMEEHGGAAFLLHSYPPLMGVMVDLAGFRGSPTSADDLLAEVGVQALLEVMEPVRKANIIAFFEVGVAEATERLFDFVTNAHPHARGLISESNVESLGRCLAEIGRGEIGQLDLANGIMLCGRALRLLSIPPGGRIADALGGREVILAQKDVAEKLLSVWMGDAHGFHRVFMEDLATWEGLGAPRR